MMDKKPGTTSFPIKTAQIKKPVTPASAGKKPREHKDSLDVPQGTNQSRLDSPTNEVSQYATIQPQAGASSGNVKVICRIRPLNQKEHTHGGNICVDFLDKKTIAIKNPMTVDFGMGNQQFTFDRVFDFHSTQEEVYEIAAKPVIQSVLEGFNGTIFAYGQTSSGKTHTMQGPSIDSPQDRGIIPRMVNTVFDHINNTPDHIEFTVKVSIVEIYMEKIRDLIYPEKANLKIREDRARGIYIEDVTEAYVSQESEVFELMKLGNAHRAISATNMNEGSSRSHSIFIMSIHQNNLHDLSAKTGKLYLVDLAGSEKVAKSGAAGQLLEEAKNINKSLSALGNVINALTDNKGPQHIPYRDSKLTRILQESLGGNSRTTLIITCSPSQFNEIETISTLRFGYRAKSIKNKPKINREFTVAELQLLLERAERTIEKQGRRIKALEKMLKEKGISLPKEDEEEIGGEEENNEEEGGNKRILDEEMEEELERLQKEREERILERKMWEMGRNDDEARIQILEEELNSEQNSVRMQTEKLNILKEEFELVNAKVMTSEKENEALIHKLASLTLKMQELEEAYTDKEEQFKVLMSLKDALMAENEELRASNQYLAEKVQEESQGIGKSPIKSGKVYTNLKKEKEKPKPVSQISKPEPKMKEVKPEEEKARRVEAEKVKLLAIGKEIAKQLSDEFKLDNEDVLKDLVLQCIEKVRTNDKEVQQEEKRRDQERKDNDVKLKRLQEDLQSERDNKRRIEREYEKLVADYDKIAKTKVADFEQVKQKIFNEAVTKERLKYEKEWTMVQKDLQNRVDKVVELEIMWDEEKEKVKNLEMIMSEGERTLRKRCQLLEQNLERMTSLYHENLSQITLANLDNQVNERKLQRKSERVNTLEKQMNEMRDNIEHYKNTIESLKALISVSNSTNIPVSQILTENWESIEGLQLYKDSIKEELVDILHPGELKEISTARKSVHAPITSKIVKHIRGGNNRNSVGPSLKSLTQSQQNMKDESNNVLDPSLTDEYEGKDES